MEYNDNREISEEQIENIIVEFLINSNVNVEGSKSETKTTIKIGK